MTFCVPAASTTCGREDSDCGFCDGPAVVVKLLAVAFDPVRVPITQRLASS